MKNKSILQSILTGLFVVLVLAASNSIVRAQDCRATTWTNQGVTGSWFDYHNWDNNGVPDNNHCALIDNGGIATVACGRWASE
jgi:hypothetical protein